MVFRLHPHCAARAGDGYAFVEQLVPHELSSGKELHAYWRNLGRLTALFHGLGSRDMTQDNIMSCGVLPAALDLEVLIAGQMALDEQPPPIGIAMEGVSVSDLSESVICTSILPMRMGNMVVSPLVEDNVSGACLPRLDGVPHSVRGYEAEYSAGFEDGYRRLMHHRDEILALVQDYGNAACRQVLLNTWSYDLARARLLSPQALSDPAKRDEVLARLNASYAPYLDTLRKVVAQPDVAALTEGDIPYYCSHAGERAILDGDGRVVGDYLARSAIEVAVARLSRLSEEDLKFEMDIIRASLDECKTMGEQK